MIRSVRKLVLTLIVAGCATAAPQPAPAEPVPRLWCFPIPAGTCMSRAVWGCEWRLEADSAVCFVPPEEPPPVNPAAQP